MEAGGALTAARERLLEGARSAQAAGAVAWESPAAAVFRGVLAGSGAQVPWEEGLLDDALDAARGFDEALSAALAAARSWDGGAGGDSAAGGVLAWGAP